MVARFDDAVATLLGIAVKHFSPSVIRRGLVLRDAAGSLTFVSVFPKSANRTAFDRECAAKLGSYVDGASATPSELLDDTILQTENVESLTVPSKDGDLKLRLLDRRIVGQDWDRPAYKAESKEPPVASFFSCKGGVGRSTALAITAAHLSSIGKSVAIVDFDIEAPGIGSFLLDHDGISNYGTVDYLLENGRNGIDFRFLSDCLSVSPITQGRGLVEVMPAVGRLGLTYPANVLTKIGRSLTDDLDSQGNLLSFADQARQLVEDLRTLKRHDVILVDSRAGLTDIAAAAVMGLDGRVFLFGNDSQQTFDNYRFMFAHIAKLSWHAQGFDRWRSKLQMVQAKAPRQPERWKDFRDKCQQLFAEFIYDEVDAGDIEGFNFDFDDELAPHFAWPILFDAAFAEFEPTRHRDQLSSEFFHASFGPFLTRITGAIFEDGVLAT